MILYFLLFLWSFLFPFYLTGVIIFWPSTPIATTIALTGTFPIFFDSCTIPTSSTNASPAGDAFVEDVGIVHESKNIGNVPVKAIVVAIGVEGQKIMTPVK